MFTTDPLGAWSAKAILSQLRGERYYRVPWMVNDTIPGYRSAWMATPPTSAVALTVQPNPATTMVTLHCMECEIREVEVYTLDGRRVLAAGSSGTVEFALDVAALAEGTYLVAVQTQGEKLVERLVVIR